MTVSYKNGKDVLPPRLLKELQRHIQGELLYIPKPEQNRASWGELSGSRTSIANRNQEIFRKYCSGLSVRDLAEMYYLSDESIRKILTKMRTAQKETLPSC
ncbi:MULTISPECIES: CD3324 family protein [Paenibacillus]|uniref:CD3324 family protein n=1 Tax=Paenibacillus TaxID=44249 RepID=UPI000F99986C|nr:CD3324 family protein [Paenibacillus bouchesdurhonensis]